MNNYGYSVLHYYYHNVPSVETTISEYRYTAGEERADVVRSMHIKVSQTSFPF